MTEIFCAKDWASVKTILNVEGSFLKWANTAFIILACLSIHYLPRVERDLIVGSSELKTSKLNRRETMKAIVIYDIKT